MSCDAVEEMVWCRRVNAGGKGSSAGVDCARARSDRVFSTDVVVGTFTLDDELPRGERMSGVWCRC